MKTVKNILKGVLLISIIAVIAFLAYQSNTIKNPDVESEKNIQKSTKLETECGKKPVFYEFLGLTPEQMTLYDPSQEELEQFDAVLKEWESCMERID
ncbi:MAG: hypothetical protein R3346_02995 [Candidatus Spechtbacterales bacterium]|nr:hypothetical protein [Candidatus Spechtbacterales bacterium]